MGLKSCWPGPENCVPINSSALSEFKPIGNTNKYSSKDDFRVKCIEIDEIFDDIERTNYKNSEHELCRNIKYLKETYAGVNKTDYFYFSKIINSIISRLNSLSCNKNNTPQVIKLIHFFYNEIKNNNNVAVKEKSQDIKLPAGPI